MVSAKWLGHLGLSVACLALAAAPVPATVLYVDDDGPAAGTGSSWEDSLEMLQYALVMAEWSGGEVTEIRVAQGTYRLDPPGDPTRTFQLLNGVTLRGGYAGLTGTDPDDRNVALYPTILSGDMYADDGPEFSNTDDNAYRVVSCIGCDATAVLDGFTVTGGNATEEEGFQTSGGGLFIDSGSPKIVNCTFQANQAFFGGGMISLYGAPTLTNCVFRGNRADYGGGVHNYYSDTTVTLCTFAGNEVQGFG